VHALDLRLTRSWRVVDGGGSLVDDALPGAGAPSTLPRTVEATVSTFNALVRFDVQARDVAVTVGGTVDAAAVDEVCQVIERSVSISGTPAHVDLTGSRVMPQTVERIRERCADIADVTGPGAPAS
jgi:hypothetical protein